MITDEQVEAACNAYAGGPRIAGIVSRAAMRDALEAAALVERQPEGDPLPKTPWQAEEVDEDLVGDMLNAGQARLCELSSNTSFNDEHQLEIYRAMRAVEAAAPHPTAAPGEYDALLRRLDKEIYDLGPQSLQNEAAAAIRKLVEESWALKQALGYSIPADLETLNNPFKCGTCEASHKSAEATEAENVRLREERDAARARCRELVQLLDEQIGTPCAEIRWQQEREAMQAEAVRLREVSQLRSTEDLADLLDRMAGAAGDYENTYGDALREAAKVLRKFDRWQPRAALMEAPDE
jgi:hypothetical protein